MDRRENIALTAPKASSATAAARPHRDRTLLIAAVVLFAAFSALRICLAAFTKTIDVTPDELRYIDLARSLFNNGTLTVRGAASDFQKILYPLSLFPALLFNDTVMQVKAIGVLNSLYVCSAVFPAMLLAKRLFDNDKVIIACMVLTLMMPDMCYSMTFMSENVYFPIALWLIWVLWEALTATGKRRSMLSLTGGILCYVAYLGKEVALAFAIAYLLVYVIMAIRGTESRRECARAIGWFLLGFLGPLAIMKMTLFRGLHNSYNQTSADVLNSPYTQLFAVYATVVDATYLIVGFAFFPIFFVAFTYRELSRDDKRLFALCLAALIVGLLTIVYTITIREDIGCEALRQHLRYVIVLFMPMLFLFIKQIGHADTAAIKRSPGRLAALAGTTVAVILLVATMFGTANLQQGFDNSQFHVLRWFNGLFTAMDPQAWNMADRRLTAISGDDGTLLAINPGIWLSRLLVVLFIGVGTIGLMGKRRIAFGTAIVAIIAALMVANNVVGYQYNMQVYGCEESQMEQTVAVDEYLAQLPNDAEVLIVNNAKQTDMDDLADTYIDDRRMVYRYVSADNLAGFVSETGVLDRTGLAALLQPSSTQTGNGAAQQPAIEYILMERGQNVTFTSSNVEVVQGIDGPDFWLFHITDSQPVTLVRS